MSGTPGQDGGVGGERRDRAAGTRSGRRPTARGDTARRLPDLCRAGAFGARDARCDHQRACSRHRLPRGARAQPGVLPPARGRAAPDRSPRDGRHARLIDAAVGRHRPAHDRSRRGDRLARTRPARPAEARPRAPAVHRLFAGCHRGRDRPRPAVRAGRRRGLGSGVDGGPAVPRRLPGPVGDGRIRSRLRAGRAGPGRPLHRPAPTARWVRPALEPRPVSPADRGGAIGRRRGDAGPGRRRRPGA